MVGKVARPVQRLQSSRQDGTKVHEIVGQEGLGDFAAEFLVSQALFYIVQVG